MACKYCSSKTKASYFNSFQYKMSLRKVLKDEPCTTSKEELQEIKQKLQCVLKKVPIAQYNKYLGLVNTNMNLNYCKYDMKPIIEFLKEHGCY